MSFFILCLLCIVQGLTEFLPISSSGHLTLIEDIFNIKTNLLLLNLFLHLSSLLAVIIFYRKKIFEILKNPFQSISYKLLISTLITCIFALLYKKLNLNQFVFSFYGICFFITAVILLMLHIFQQHSIYIKNKEISYKDAFLVGIVQGFAVLPGISRSGSTIATLLFCKNEEKKSAEYSFLMSIPIIIGGFIIETCEISHVSQLLENINIWYYLLAFILTFIVALFSLKITVKMLKNQKFIYFSTYLFLISIIIMFVKIL